MKNIQRASLMFAAIGAILAPAGLAGAQIVLSQPSLEVGQNYAAFFKVGRGCEGSPTTALSVQIPDGVMVLDTPSKPGWTVSAKRDKGQVSGVTWRGKLAAQLESLYADSSATYSSLTYRDGLHFVLYFKPPAQQPMLIALRSLQKPADVITILDPNKLDPTGGTAIDWFAPSHDGKLVAVCLSRHGSEDGALHFFETETGRKIINLAIQSGLFDDQPGHPAQKGP